MIDWRRLPRRVRSLLGAGRALHGAVAPTFDPGAFYRRHDALIAEGRPAEAAAEMERLAALQPDDPIAHYRIGCYRHESSGLAAALPHYLRAAACDVSGHHA